MKRYHILFYDPFVRNDFISKYIAEKCGMHYVPIGHLYCKNIFTENPEKGKKIERGEITSYSVFESLLIEYLRDYDSVIIPDYPRFLESATLLECLINDLNKIDYKLEKIWYVENTNIGECINQSLRMKGYKNPSQTIFNSSFERAQENQKNCRRLITEVESRHIVCHINADSFDEITENTKSEIDRFSELPA